MATRSAGSRRRGGVLAWVVGALVVIGVGSAAALMLMGDGPAGKGSAADVVAASVQDFDILTTATGELEAKSQIELRSELENQSTIVELVKEGKRVEAGELLVKLNSDDIQQKIDEEVLQVESARAAAVAAENAYTIQESENDSKERQATLKRDLAQLALTQWRDGDDVKKRKELSLALERAERELARLTDKFERSKELFDRQFLSKNDLDIDELAYIEAQAKLVTAKLDIEIYETYQRPKDEKSKVSDVEEAEAELERTRQQNGIQLASKEADKLNRQRQLVAREQRLAKLRDQFDKCEIKAPSAGLVVYDTSINAGMRWNDSGPLQIGTQVYPNQRLIVLPDTSEMVASVRVHESLAGKIREGQSATVRIDALGGASVTGEVLSVAVLAESGGWRDPNRREYTVKIALQDTSEAKLKPSMRCEADILLDRVEQALAVPVQAVFTDQLVRFVYARRGDRYARVPVKVGKRSSVLAEIVAGLGDGDEVLTREPDPAEILAGDFKPEQLAAVGIRLDESGKPVAETRPNGKPGEGPPRGGEGKQRDRNVSMRPGSGGPG